MKNILSQSTSILINLLEGAAAVIALTVSYAFIFEKENHDHNTGLGMLVLLVWLLVLLIPNLVFKFGKNFHIKDSIFFQLVPLVLGAVLYIVFQLAVY